MIDMDYVAKNVSDVQKFLELCPNPTTGDIGKMLAVQAAVLQAEGLGLLQDAGELPGAAKVRRVALAVEVLRVAAESFLGADKILARNERTELEFQRELEKRRIANQELIAEIAAAGLLVAPGDLDGLKLLGPVDPEGGELVVTQKRRRRAAWEKYAPAGVAPVGETPSTQ